MGKGKDRLVVRSSIMNVDLVEGDVYKVNFWSNLYFERPITTSFHKTKQDADKWALHDRSMCVEITTYYNKKTREEVEKP